MIIYCFICPLLRTFFLSLSLYVFDLHPIRVFTTSMTWLEFFAFYTNGTLKNRSWLKIEKERKKCLRQKSWTTKGVSLPPWKKPSAHLDSSSTHNALSGWLKRNGGFYCRVFSRPPSSLSSRWSAELQLSSKQGRHPLFISYEILMRVMKGLK